jgi:predicted nucleic acid-binding protein
MTSRKVYIASDGFVAFIDRGHSRHVTAGAFFRYFAIENFQLYTSPITINNTYDELYRTISPSIAKDFLRAMYMSSINIIYPEPSDIKSAIKTVATSNVVELTFSKAYVSVICNKRNIPQIYTFEYLPSLFGLQAFYLPV